jgi:hypothetical protein
VRAECGPARQGNTFMSSDYNWPDGKRIAVAVTAML